MTQDHGSGTALVFIHGIGEDSRIWEPQVRELSDRFRTVAYDIRGHGSAPLGDADGSLEQLRDDAAALCERLDLGPAVLVGFSLGGTVALALAAHRPELVAGVVAIATSSVVGRGAAAAYQGQIELFERADRDEIRAALREHLAGLLVSEASDLDSILAAELESTGDGAGYSNAAAAMIGLRDRPLTAALGSVQAPVLLVSGERDTLCPDRAQQIMAEALPVVERVEIPGAGHLMVYEQSERLTELVGDFAAGQPAGLRPETIRL